MFNNNFSHILIKYNIFFYQKAVKLGRWIWKFFKSLIWSRSEKCFYPQILSLTFHFTEQRLRSFQIFCC